MMPNGLLACIKGRGMVNLGKSGRKGGVFGSFTRYKLSNRVDLHQFGSN